MTLNENIDRTVQGADGIADPFQGAERGPVVGYVPGGFDMFHIGHLNVLRLAREHCDILRVGVASDESLRAQKGRAPVVPFEERIAIVRAIGIVDEAVEDVSPAKRVAWERAPFHVLVKGSDWKGTPRGERLERDMDEVGVRVVYVQYTTRTSSTMLRAAISSGIVA